MVGKKLSVYEDKIEVSELHDNQRIKLVLCNDNMCKNNLEEKVITKYPMKWYKKMFKPTNITIHINKKTKQGFMAEINNYGQKSKLGPFPNRFFAQLILPDNAVCKGCITEP